MENIGKRIKSLRIQHGMSADQLAGILGKKGENRKQFIYDLESGRVKRLSMDILSKLSEALNISLTSLIQSENKNNQHVDNLSAMNGSDDWESKYCSLERKYVSTLEECSRLKSKIIELMSQKVQPGH